MYQLVLRYLILQKPSAVAISSVTVMSLSSFYLMYEVVRNDCKEREIQRLAAVLLGVGC